MTIKIFELPRPRNYRKRHYTPTWVRLNQHMFKAASYRFDLLNQKKHQKKAKKFQLGFLVALFCTQRTMLIGRYQFGAVISPVSPHSMFFEMFVLSGH